MTKRIALLTLILLCLGGSAMADQAASTDANTVMSTFDATAGSASRRITSPNESPTTLIAPAAPATETGAAPSWDRYSAARSRTRRRIGGTVMAVA